MRRGLVCVAVALCVLVSAGCSGGGDKAEAREVVRLFLEDLAARQFDRALGYLSGDALDAAGSLFPALKAAQYEAKLLGLELRVTEFSPGSGRALVDARYTLEQRVPGSGTVAQEVWAAFHLRRVAGEWKICLAYTVARK
ncbi:MAG: hypothetical protein AB1816_03800 [Bacillota bacterium]